MIIQIILLYLINFTLSQSNCKDLIDSSIQILYIPDSQTCILNSWNSQIILNSLNIDGTLQIDSSLTQDVNIQFKDFKQGPLGKLNINVETFTVKFSQVQKLYDCIALDPLEPEGPSIVAIGPYTYPYNISKNINKGQNFIEVQEKPEYIQIGLKYFITQVGNTVEGINGVEILTVSKVVENKIYFKENILTNYLKQSKYVFHASIQALRLQLYPLDNYLIQFHNMCMNYYSGNFVGVLFSNIVSFKIKKGYIKSSLFYDIQLKQDSFNQMELFDPVQVSKNIFLNIGKTICMTHQDNQQNTFINFNGDILLESQTIIRQSFLNSSVQFRGNDDQLQKSFILIACYFINSQIKIDQKFDTFNINGCSLINSKFNHSGKLLEGQIDISSNQMFGNQIIIPQSVISLKIQNNQFIKSDIENMLIISIIDKSKQLKFDLTKNHFFNFQSQSCFIKIEDISLPNQFKNINDPNYNLLSTFSQNHFFLNSPKQQSDVTCSLCPESLSLPECTVECSLNFFSQLSQCVQCPIECAYCSEDAKGLKCLECSKDYYLNSSGECISESDLSGICKPNQILNKQVCQDCLVTQFAYFMECRNCHSACSVGLIQGCNGPSESQCYKCEIKSQLYNELDKQCVDECPINTIKQDLVCKSCSLNCEQKCNQESCMQCTSIDVCTLCISNYYLDINTGICYKFCPSSLLVYTNTCVSTCPKHTLEINNQCIKVCLIVVNDICTQCIDNYLLDVESGLCNDFCLRQTYQVDSKCHKCLEEDQLIYKTCQQCKQLNECLSCWFDPNYCTECKQGLLNYRGQCVNSCPTLTYRKNNSCNDCLQKDILIYEVCQTCKQSQCKKCPKDASKCTLCYEKFKLYANVCYLKCPSYTYEIQSTCINKDETKVTTETKKLVNTVTEGDDGMENNNIIAIICSFSAVVIFGFIGFKYFKRKKIIRHKKKLETMIINAKSQNIIQINNDIALTQEQKKNQYNSNVAILQQDPNKIDQQYRYQPKRNSIYNGGTIFPISNSGNTTNFVFGTRTLIPLSNTLNNGVSKVQPTFQNVTAVPITQSNAPVIVEEPNPASHKS